MKELTVIANYRVIFYANISKNYLFDEFVPEEMNEGKQLCELQKHYFDMYETSMNCMEANNLNLDILEKLSISTKIISGTYNLSKMPDKDSYTEKFKNYKVMEYGSKIMKALES